MRLLIANHGLYPDVIGGMERHTFNMAKSLQDLGVEVHVAVPEPSKGTSFPFPVHHLPWPRRPAWLWSNWEFSKHVSELMAKLEPDIAWSQGFNLWACLKMRKIPIVFHPHGLDMYANTMLGKSWVVAALLREIVQYHIRHSDVVVSLGGRLTSILRSEAQAPLAKIVELPNAIVDAEIDRIPCSKTPNSFLFVGRLAFNKGLDWLRSATSSLKGKDFTLDIVGTGPLHSFVEEWCREDPRVTFHGPKVGTELVERMQRAECLLFTSRFEGMPTVILEGMAHFCSVIATDIGAVSVMINPDTGILVSPGPQGIALGMSKFLSQSADERNKQRVNAQRMVRAEFTWEKLAPSYFKLLEELLHRE